MNPLHVLIVTLHKITYYWMTFHNYKCSRLIITLMFYQFTLVSKCLITHITETRAIALYIPWQRAKLLCWTNILSCTSLEYPLVVIQLCIYIQLCICANPLL